jgi:hypothetical protein
MVGLSDNESRDRHQPRATAASGPTLAPVVEEAGKHGEIGPGLVSRIGCAIQKSYLPAIEGILLQKSFCTGDQKFCGLQARLSCKDVRTSSPHVKLTGDFGNAIEVIRIGDRFPFRVFAKNSGPATFDFCNKIEG